MSCHGGEKGRDKREGVTCLLADDTATWLLYVLSVVGERVAGPQRREEEISFRGRNWDGDTGDDSTGQLTVR